MSTGNLDTDEPSDTASDIDTMICSLRINMGTIIKAHIQTMTLTTCSKLLDVADDRSAEG